METKASTKGMPAQIEACATSERSIAEPIADELLGRQSAIAEAHALYRMIGHGSNTVEALRELIVVPCCWTSPWPILKKRTRS